jgi:hypothetical protein
MSSSYPRLENATHAYNNNVTTRESFPEMRVLGVRIDAPSVTDTVVAPWSIARQAVSASPPLSLRRLRGEHDAGASGKS